MVVGVPVSPLVHEACFSCLAKVCAEQVLGGLGRGCVVHEREGQGLVFRQAVSTNVDRIVSELSWESFVIADFFIDTVEIAGVNGGI